MNNKIGWAVEQMEKGEKVTRKGWGDNGVFIYHVAAASYPAANNEHGTMKGICKDDLVPYQAYIAIKTADGSVVPYVFGTDSILADDWQLFTGVARVGPIEAEIKDIEFYSLMNYDHMEDELRITAKYTDGSKEKIKVTGRIKTSERLNVHRDYFLAHLEKLQSDEAKEWLEMYGRVEVIE